MTRPDAAANSAGRPAGFLLRSRAVAPMGGGVRDDGRREESVRVSDPDAG